MVVLAGVRDDLNGVLQCTIQGVGESDGEILREEIDIQLEVALRVEAADY